MHPKRLPYKTTSYARSILSPYQKKYASTVIEDLQKMEAVELLEEPPIPEWQKKEVRSRMKALKKNPALAIPWDEANKTIKQL